MELTFEPNPFIDFPHELILYLAMFLAGKDLFNLGRCNQKFRRTLLDNNLLWKRKFHVDYKYDKLSWNPIRWIKYEEDQATEPKRHSWKSLYKDFVNVWSFGRNSFGSLGTNDGMGTNIPKPIRGFTKGIDIGNFMPNGKQFSGQAKQFSGQAKQVAAGLYRTAILDLQNDVFVCGMDLNFLVGSGNHVGVSIPSQILNICSSAQNKEGNTMNGIKAASISISDSSFAYVDFDNTPIIVNNDGYVHCLGDMKASCISFGISHIGTLYVGIMDINQNVVLYENNRPGNNRRGNNTKLRNSNRNRVLKCSDKTSNPRYLFYPDGSKFKASQISLGCLHIVLIDENNDVYTFGSNTEGQLGLGHYYNINVPTKIPDIKAKKVAAGHYHTLVIDLDDNVLAFGRNNRGQLGLGNCLNRNIPTMIPNIKARKVASAKSHTAIIDFNCDLFMCGKGKNGRLGLGDNLSRNIPTKLENFKVKDVAVGRDHTVIIGYSI